MAKNTIGELVYKITGDTTGLQESTKRSGGLLDKLKKNWLAAAAAVAGYALALRSLITTYARQEMADIRLRRALKNTGDETEETYNRFKDFASEIQKITTVGDEATQELVALGLAMGQTTDNIEAVTKGAIGLSKSFGVDANTAMKALTQATNGNFSLLQRYIPALQSATDESEKQAIVNQAVADGFKLATDEAETTTGKLEQLGNAFGDSKEEIGKFVAEAILPVVKFLTILAASFNNLPEGIGKSSIALLTVGVPAFIGLNAAAGPLGIAIAGIVVGLMAIPKLFNAFGEAARERDTQFLADVDSRIEKQQQELDLINQRDKRQRDALEVTTKRRDLVEEETEELKKQLAIEQQGIRDAKKINDLRDELDVKLDEERKLRRDVLSLERSTLQNSKERGESEEAIAKLQGAKNELLERQKANMEEAKDLVQEITLEFKIQTQETEEQNEELEKIKTKLDAISETVRALDTISGVFDQDVANQLVDITSSFVELTKALKDGEITAKDWISAIIQVVQLLEKEVSKGYKKALEDGNEEAAKTVGFFKDILSGLFDIRSALASVGLALLGVPPVLNFILTGFVKNRLEAKKLIDETDAGIEELITSFDALYDSLTSDALNKAVDMWQEYATEVLRINTGLQDALDKQSEFASERTERRQNAELDVLKDVLQSDIDENEKALAQKRVDEIENERALVIAQEEFNRQKEQLDKDLQLVRLAIKAAEFQSEIDLKAALLDADQAAALAQASTIRNRRLRNEAILSIDSGFSNARSALGRASTAGGAGLELERQFLSGQITPEDMEGAGGVISSLADDTRTQPIIITIDGKQVSQTTIEYLNNNLVGAIV